MRFIFTSDVQIGTFGSQANGTESYSCEPAITIPSGSEKIERETLTSISNTFPEGTEISPAGKFTVS